MTDKPKLRPTAVTLPSKTVLPPFVCGGGEGEDEADVLVMAIAHVGKVKQGTAVNLSCNPIDAEIEGVGKRQVVPFLLAGWTREAIKTEIVRKLDCVLDAVEADEALKAAGG